MAEAAGFRLSPQQRRSWNLMAAGGSAYHAWARVAVREVSGGALRQAIAETVAAEEILRTRFRRPADLTVLLQVVVEDCDFDWAEHDLSGLPPKARRDAVERLLAEVVARPWDLAEGPLLRAVFARFSTARGDLVLALPSLSADAGGLANLVGRIDRRLAGVDGGAAPDEPLQYADLAEWLLEMEEADEFAPGREHWASLDVQGLREAGALGGLPPEEVEEPAFEVDSLDLALPPGAGAQLAAVSRGLDAPQGDLVAAAWTAFWGRTEGRERIAFGLGLDGRDYAELEDSVGPLSRVVPVVGELAAGTTFTELVGRIAEEIATAASWQECFRWDLVGGADAGAVPYLPLSFLERDLPGARLDTRVEVRDLGACGDRFAVQLVALLGRAGEEPVLRWRFDRRRLSALEVRRLAGRFATLLQDALEAPARAVGDLALLSAAETQALLVEQPPVAAARRQPAVHLAFAACADRHPDRVAVVWEGVHVSYGELARRSRDLAGRLRALGAGPERVVALCLERSPDFLVGLLGTLASGAAYAPLDPRQPAERLASMHGALGAVVTVIDASGRRALPARGGARLDLDRPEHRAAAGPSPLPAEPLPDQLAYVLFTSGSTGAPKGVAVGHDALRRYVGAVSRALDLPDEASYGLVSTFAADLGYTMVFPALARGGCLHLLSDERVSGAEAFSSYLRSRPVDCLKIVPGHLVALHAASTGSPALPRRRLVLGGERLPGALAASLRAGGSCRVFNHYGPTETTVGVTTHEVSPEAPAGPGTVPLGRPLAGTRVLVADPRLHPVPPGTPGELLVGGGQVARGYLGAPARTAERFVPAPAPRRPGERLYRTGDLARLGPRGELEFLGRVDRQLKLHGFRIEPGEIEAALETAPGVRRAVVSAAAAGDATPRLVAYVQPTREARPSLDDIRAHLRRRLPEPMIPASVCVLQQLPLTPNGKVDHAALPPPDSLVALSSAAGGRPRNAVEATLVEIWRRVLGVEQVGIHDNFFALGGDSILSIQVGARASEAGLRLSPLEIFERPTIAELAERAGDAAAVDAEQGGVVGRAPLLPVQRAFYGRARDGAEHWNQSLLLRLRRPIDAGVMYAAVARLLDHHDALRSRFPRVGPDAGHRVQEVAPPGGEIPFHAVDLSALAAPVRGQRIEAVAEQVQRSLDLETGPITRFVVFHLGGGKPRRVLVVVHHLAVDGVSWRVLLEDFQRLCEPRTEAGRERPALPPKTTSFKRWAELLAEHAASAEAEAELDHWRALAERGAPGPPAALTGSAGERGHRRTVVELEAEETRSLLQDLPRVFSTEVNDALLAALALALTRFDPGFPGPLWIELEGHGREPIVPGVDLSRTVGWFTSLFPVVLDLPVGAAAEEALESVARRLREVPRRGIGFGVLRHLSPREDVRRELARLATPWLRFNYLGQLDQVVARDSWFEPAPEARGRERSERVPRRHLLDVVASVQGGRLVVRWWPDAERLDGDAVARLARCYLDAVRSLLEAAASPSVSEGEAAPDLTVTGLQDEDLERVLAQSPDLA